MSMNFSEFKKILGSEPRSSDPAFLRARSSAPEFESAAREAEQFESRLESAARLPAPDGLLDGLRSIGRNPVQPAWRRWAPLAVAASLLLAVGAAGMTYKLLYTWDSVEDYLVDHYRHDGSLKFSTIDIEEVQGFFSHLDVWAAPALAGVISAIKFCPTPDGKGIHMILNTDRGLVTVIYMPETPVIDHELFAFDDVEALLVALERGSAAIIGPDEQAVSGLYAFIQESIVPAAPSS